MSNFTSQLSRHQDAQNLGKKEAIGFVGVASVSGLCIAMLMPPHCSITCCWPLYCCGRKGVYQVANAVGKNMA